MQDPVFMVLRLVLAGIFGGIVGYEREVHEHPAGLRTHILVCLGAALITMVSVSFRPPDGDPGRIAAQIVSGIGFLGAGTILRQGSIVRGLTTAASLWTVAGIGIAVGVGGALYLMLAAVATAVVFVTLSTLRSMDRKDAAHRLHVEMTEDQLHVMGEVLQKITDLGATIHSIRTSDTVVPDRRAFTMRVSLSRRAKLDAIVETLANQEGLARFEWK